MTVYELQQELKDADPESDLMVSIGVYVYRLYHVEKESGLLSVNENNTTFVRGKEPLPETDETYVHDPIVLVGAS